MTLQGSGKMRKSSQGKNTIYVQTKLAEDSQFPFEHGENLKISIKENKIIIEKAEEE